MSRESAYSQPRALKLVLPPDTPRLANISIHGDVLLFAAAVSLFTGILAGLAPRSAARLDLEDSLKLNETNVFGTARRFRTSSLLVIGQIALAVIVITAAGVMLHSLSGSRVLIGFRTDRVVSAQISLDRNACTKKGSCTAFYQSLLDRAQSLPGITGTALIDVLPLTGSDTSYVFDAEGHPRVNATLNGGLRPYRLGGLSQADGNSFAAGRLFSAFDASGKSRAIIINTSMANHLWPNQDPLGKHMMSVGVEPSPAVMDINAASIVVGVVSDTRHESLDKASGWEVYLPLSPANEKSVMNILVRSNAGAGEVASSLRRMVAEIDPNIPVTRVRTMDEVLSSSTASRRSLTLLLMAFALLAVGVGSVGVYSLIAYTVSWRTREFGLRIALGANRMQVAMLMSSESRALLGGLSTGNRRCLRDYAPAAQIPLRDQPRGSTHLCRRAGVVCGAVDRCGTVAGAPPRVRGSSP